MLAIPIRNTCRHPGRHRAARGALVLWAVASLAASLAGCQAAAPASDADGGDGAGSAETVDVRTVDFTTFTAIASSPLNDLPKMKAWRRVVPEIEEVRIPSSSGGDPQPALFYDSGSREPRPLLVALHSWTADYRKPFSIPYGAWAAKNDWVMIHPNYGGYFNDPHATLSEGAVEDILDALAWARQHAAVDPERIYVTGFSGGAMAALVMVGRHPDLWTAAAAWVPVYDLVDWYETISRHPDLHYASDIVASCGGNPLEVTDAARECRRRSPSSYLSNARGHDVEVLVTTGIEDWFVPPRHALDAFDALAEPDDRLSAEEIEMISSEGEVPESLASRSEHPLVEAAGRRVLGERRSGQVELWIFDGSHDVIYNAGLAWLARQRRE